MDSNNLFGKEMGSKKKKLLFTLFFLLFVSIFFLSFYTRFPRHFLSLSRNCDSELLFLEDYNFSEVGSEMKLVCYIPDNFSESNRIIDCLGRYEHKFTEVDIVKVFDNFSQRDKDLQIERGSIQLLTIDCKKSKISFSRQEFDYEEALVKYLMSLRMEDFFLGYDPTAQVHYLDLNNYLGVNMFLMGYYNERNSVTESNAILDKLKVDLSGWSRARGNYSFFYPAGKRSMHQLTSYDEDLSKQIREENFLLLDLLSLDILHRIDYDYSQSDFTSLNEMLTFATYIYSLDYKENQIGVDKKEYYPIFENYINKVLDIMKISEEDLVFNVRYIEFINSPKEYEYFRNMFTEGNYSRFFEDLTMISYYLYKVAGIKVSEERIYNILNEVVYEI